MSRVVARSRRGVARLVRARPERPWVVRVEPPYGVRASRAPIHVPWSRRLYWSTERGLSRSVQPRISTLVIDVTDIDDLAAFGRDPAAVTRVRRVRIHIAAWRAPAPGWVGRLGPITGVTRADVRVPHIGPAHVRIRLDLTSPRPIREVIGAVVDLLVPASPMPFPQSPTLGANARLPAWLPVGEDAAGHFLGSALTFAADGTPVDVVSGIKRNPDNPPPNRPAADAELVMPDGTAAGFGVAPIPSLAVTDHGVVVQGVGTQPALLDVRGRPAHRWSPPAVADAHGRLVVRVIDGERRWRLIGPGTGGSTTVSTRADAIGPWFGIEAPFDTLGGPDPFGWWSLACDVAEDVPPADATRLVLRAALSGVVLDGRALPETVRELLSPELAHLLCEPLPAPGSEPLLWETRSVRQRRAVVRGHATSLVMHDRVRPGAAVAVAPPTVTALLVTRRPRFASLALRMLRDQTYPRFEIIVGLHGQCTVPELEREAAACTAPVEIIEIPATTTLGEALGLVTERARGTFVAKIDDDDIYGPEHVWDLVIARALSGATVVGKGGEFVMLDQLGVTVRRDTMASDAFNRVVAGGTILMPRGELESLGGWRPVRSGVDRALLDRVLQGGGSVYRTWPTGFIYRRHGQGHTWGPADAYFLRGASMRWEGIPDLPEFGAHHVRDLAGGPSGLH